MRTLVLGDIHGGLKALEQVLKLAEVTPKDKLIFLGDYVDGWSESAQVIEFLISLSNKNDCVFIQGNHDIWCKEWLESGVVNPVWEQNGGKKTMESYQDIILLKTQHLEFFTALKPYYLDAENRAFIHAGFKHSIKEDSPITLCTDRTLLYTAVEQQENNKSIPEKLKQYNEIYIGHTPVQRFNMEEPAQFYNLWNLDTGAAFYGKISLMDIETKTFWESSPVHTLYPNELGRNK